MKATNALAVKMIAKLALAVLGVAASACGRHSPTAAPPAPSFSVDDVVVASTVEFSGTRQQLKIDVTAAAGAMAFGQALGAIHATIDLSAVPNDDPSKYDIKLIAACSNTQDTVVSLGGASLAELDGTSQESWSQLALDGCVLGTLLDGYKLTGSTNIDKLDATHVEASLFFSLERGTEKHRFGTDYGVAKF